MLSCNFFRQYPELGGTAALRWSSRLTGSRGNCGRWRPHCPAAARRWTRRCVPTPSPGFCATRTPRAELRDGAMCTSSLAADAAGREGSTYVWTPAQLAAALGDNDGPWAASIFGVTAAGTFEEGASVLQRPVDPADPERFERVRAALLAARLARPQPGRDDKVVTAWNGLAITALAEASVALNAPELVDAAGDCA